MIEKPPVVPVAPSEGADAAPVEAAAGVPPIGDSEFAEAHRRLLGDSGIQFDLPRFEPPQPSEPPDWLRSLFGWMSSDHPLLRILLWALLAAAVLLILYLIARWAMGLPLRRGGGDADEAAGEPLVEASRARALLSEADALAERGLFSEAAHLLLFRSLEDVEARRPGLLRPALTSRDIAALPALPERPRGAFARIAATVEKGLFARRALAEGDWRDCRAAYEEFAFAEGWR